MDDLLQGYEERAFDGEAIGKLGKTNYSGIKSEYKVFTVRAEGEQRVEVCVRFIPAFSPYVKAGTFLLPVFRHELRAVEGRFGMMVLCTNPQHNAFVKSDEGCRICAALRKYAHPDAWQYFKVKRPWLLTWIIDRDRMSQGPMLWYFPKTLVEDLNVMAGRKCAGRDIAHPLEGYDIVVSRSGTGFNTRYRIVDFDGPKPLSSDRNDMREWLKYVKDHPIHDVFEPVSAEDQDLFVSRALSMLYPDGVPDGDGGSPVSAADELDDELPF